MLDDIKEVIKDVIKDADMVLVGLGEEFNDISTLKQEAGYIENKNMIEELGLLWLLPAYDNECRNSLIKRKEEVKDALSKLAEMLQDKNYFVVSTSVNDVIEDIPWKAGRLVMPCGVSRMKQCSAGCDEVLEEMTDADSKTLAFYMKKIFSKEKSNLINKMDAAELAIPDLGRCSKCGNPLVLNNIYAENYNENGYLSQWKIYTKWLQGTLNRRIVILELGVGMKFPSVIRFPFEKIAFFNQKAAFYRVNGTLYQMSEELKNKGISISKNSIDWLRGI